jgi:hypothetical protein
VYSLTEKETIVVDKGLYYEIKNPLDYQSIEKALEKKMDILLSLVAKNIEVWNNILKTIKGKNKKEIKKEKAQNILKRRCKNILKVYMQIHLPPRKPKETLLAPLELSATKGFREEIRSRKYDEGKEFKISEEDWVLAIIGALHSLIWQFIPKDENIIIIPSPDEEKGVDVSHLKDIKQFITKVNHINRTSVITLIAHYAIRLYQELWNRKRSTHPWMDRFTSFVYGSLVKAGPQLKPKVGGYFSLELFEKILQASNGGEILKHFDHIFTVAKEDTLAILCAEFLANPSLENYTKFVDIYIRTALRKNIKIERPSQKTWKEITKYVI